MSEFMKLKSPGVLGIIDSEGRVSDTRRVFHAASSASNQPPPRLTLSSDEAGSAAGAGSTAPATTAGGVSVSRDVAQAVINGNPIVIPRNMRWVRALICNLLETASRARGECGPFRNLRAIIACQGRWVLACSTAAAFRYRLLCVPSIPGWQTRLGSSEWQ